MEKKIMYQSVYNFGDAKINEVTIERETDHFYFSISGRRIPKVSHHGSVFGSFDEARDFLIKTISADIEKEIENHIAALKRKQSQLDSAKQMTPRLRIA